MSLPLWVLIAIAVAAAWLITLAVLVGLLIAAARADHLDEAIERYLRGDR